MLDRLRADAPNSRHDRFRFGSDFVSRLVYAYFHLFDGSIGAILDALFIRQLDLLGPR